MSMENICYHQGVKMNPFELSAKDKIIRARVGLNKSHPFFARMTMALVLVEEKEVGTMDVNKYGVLYYNPEFVDKLTEGELMGVLCHEVAHCMMEHMTRGEKKDHFIYNVAGDLIINDMVQQNGLALPKDALLPSHSHKYEMKLPEDKTYTIEKINEKGCESIYTEIKNALGKQKSNQLQQGHDKHKYGDKTKGKGQKGVEHRDGDYWKGKVVESAMASKMAGKEPKGMERIIDNLLNPKMSWQQLLQRFVRNRIPYDFTWRRPSKKFHSTGIYLPKTTKEGVKIALLIDTSGSVSKEDLEKVFGEMKGIVSSVVGLEMNVYFHDTKMYAGKKLTNPSIRDVHQAILDSKGGGGTDFSVAYDYLEKNEKDLDMVCHFTDGCDTFPQSFKHDLLICLSGRWAKKVEDVKKECKYATVIEVKE